VNFQSSEMNKYRQGKASRWLFFLHCERHDAGHAGLGGGGSAPAQL
jgi:hypothetical protein